MQAPFKEFLDILMAQEGGLLEINSFNTDSIEIFYTIEYLQADDFYLTAMPADGDVTEYETETDYDSLIHDFRNDIITHLTLLNENGDVVNEYKSDYKPPLKEIPVDYSRKIPKNMNECPICLESLIVDICANKKCKHTFHCACISQWVRGNEDRGCPVCRRELQLYKLADIHDYSKIAGFTLFGSRKILEDISYLKNL
jgi:hypothetical protein